MAWKYFALSIPVSSITGPVGSFLGSHLHRQVVAGFVYVLELVALTGFLFTRPSWQLIATGEMTKSATHMVDAPGTDGTKRNKKMEILRWMPMNHKY
ncbi:hypothetical protein NECAME_06313 [Necator americanus]|uniref:Uncharacterized protein n=1 Tax=Necator americanus TaxID=51031 RepID=W2TU44_NECAM|nr:hypothetical protein NECAME_06313 [Necator americanus]ETN85610.1 hypothetical protein NECAME_06313 [Necator americanus]